MAHKCRRFKVLDVCEPQAPERTFWVNLESGDDANDGLTYDAPFKTVSRAHQAASEFDEIIVVSDAARDMMKRGGK